MTHRYRLSVAATVCAALLVTGAPAAFAAPASDDRGFVDSTARCAAPATAVVFGRTASSRVAICADADGGYQYRGVRVRDGARLITSAKAKGDGDFTADNDGVTYTVTADALTVSVGSRVLRKERMVEFQRNSSSTSKPASPAQSAPAPQTNPTPTRTTPLPPPLPAEVGGSAS